MFKILKFCMKYAKNYKILMILYYFIIIISGFFNLFLPFFTGKIIDLIVDGEKSIICKSIFLFGIINLLYIVCKFLSNRIYVKLQTNTVFDITKNIFEHMQKLPLSTINTIDTAYMNQRINNDTNSIVTFSINIVGNFLINFITILFSIFLLIRIDMVIGLIMVAMGGLYMISYFLLKKIIYNLSFTLKEEQAQFFSTMLMQLNDIKFIKIHSLIQEYKKKLNTCYNSYYGNVLKTQNFFFVYSSLDAIITVVVNILIFIIGGNKVIDGTISIGSLTIILSYFNFIVSSFKYFSNLGKEYQDNKVSYDRLLELYNLEEETRGEYSIEKIEKIQCKNLSFKRNNKNLFSNFNYVFTTGKIYCICGENGCGKTTLIETLLGLYPKDYIGQILYNDINIRDLDMYQLRRNKISVMEQYVHLLEGNFEDNIFLTADYSLDQLKSILGIDNILNMKKSSIYCRKISYDKSGISGGESQKIGLFRLLSKQANVYILDEPTASLDRKSIESFMHMIQSLKKDKIIIIISHNLETIQMCDCVIDI